MAGPCQRRRRARRAIGLLLELLWVVRLEQRWRKLLLLRLLWTTSIAGALSFRIASTRERSSCRGEAPKKVAMRARQGQSALPGARETAELEYKVR
jgi:hypothetical protein